MTKILSQFHYIYTLRKVYFCLVLESVLFANHSQENNPLFLVHSLWNQMYGYNFTQHIRNKKVYYPFKY